MAIINYTDQLKYAGKGYLDAKMMPVNTVDDLYSISLTQRFEGLTLTVLNNGKPQDYWLVGGITNKCWIPKTATSFDDLKIVLEDGFLKLCNNEVQLGDAVNLNDFFPENTDDLYISSVDYTTQDGDGVDGIFMCFTYSDDTKKYLDMSQFLSSTYEAGNGIVINGNVISLDAAISGRIETIEGLLETKADASIVEELTKRIEEEESVRIDEDTILQKNIDNEATAREAAINSLSERLNVLSGKITTNQNDITTVKQDINTLQERVNALSEATEGSTPDDKTIGITDDEQKALYVKILNKEGNILKTDTNELGETGLYAYIPIYCEDEELN